MRPSRLNRSSPPFPISAILRTFTATRRSNLPSLRSASQTVPVIPLHLLRESLPPTARGAHEAVFPVDMPELGSRSGGRTARTSAHHLSFPALRRGVD